MCVELVEGCSDCEREGAYKEQVGHECGSPRGPFTTTCEMFGRMRREDEKFHRLTHAPILCESCSAVLDDKLGGLTYETRLCPSELCTEWVCPHCDVVQSSAGPVNCPSCGWAANRLRVSRIRRAYAAKSRRRR